MMSASPPAETEVISKLSRKSQRLIRIFSKRHSSKVTVPRNRHLDNTVSPTNVQFTNVMGEGYSGRSAVCDVKLSDVTIALRTIQVPLAQVTLLGFHCSRF